MHKNYIGLWLILSLGLALFVLTSSYDSLRIDLKPSKFYATLTDTTYVAEAIAAADTATVVEAEPEKIGPDTTSKTILFLGDSMLEGLSPRMAAYAHHNGHKLYSVMWYSSSTQIWAESDNVTKYIEQFKPDYIFISLGGNELFIKDIREKRDGFVKKILREIGDIPYVWIGPPNWKPDTGINDMIAANTKKGCFFLSNGMEFKRSKDGAHPTRESAANWLDSVARWMPAHCAHPIKMETPAEKSDKADQLVVLQPVTQ